MRLKKMAEIQSGYISRGRIEPHENGNYFLMQARDLDADNLTYSTSTLIRFNPVLSRRDWILESGDVLFMARGARNFSVLLKEIPNPLLAAACFFIVRVRGETALPGYVCWYLNQAPVERYLQRSTGRGGKSAGPCPGPDGQSGDTAGFRRPGPPRYRRGRQRRSYRR